MKNKIVEYFAVLYFYAVSIVFMVVVCIDQSVCVQIKIMHISITKYFYA